MGAGHAVRRLPVIAALCFAWISTHECLAADGPLASPTVAFTLDFPNANPSHYEITIDRAGHGRYVSNGQLEKDSSPTDPAPLEFTISNRVRDQIFDLAQRAHYFSGKVDSGRKNIANTGTKTLTYKDGEHNGSATYNYSTSAPVEQLTAIFQGLSETLEFGRRLSFFHKYQKLALDEDLKRMEELQNDNNLGDIQAIAPVLKEIADDQSVMNVARARALRLMATAK
jgi:hypothetical protein